MAPRQAHKLEAMEKESCCYFRNKQAMKKKKLGFIHATSPGQANPMNWKSTSVELSAFQVILEDHQEQS